MPNPWDSIKITFLTRYLLPCSSERYINCNVKKLFLFCKQLAKARFWLFFHVLIIVSYFTNSFEINSNTFKSNAHRPQQRQRQTVENDVCRKNSLREGLSLQTKIGSVLS